MMVESQPRKLVALGPLVVGVVGVAVVPLRSILVPGLFLLCPLAMLFMHGAHGREGHEHRTEQRRRGSRIQRSESTS